jgi:hypothetical protein
MDGTGDSMTTNEGLIITSIGGYCPCQADGTMDGFPFYFRARWDGWTLSVAAPGEDPVRVFVDNYHDGLGTGAYFIGEYYQDAGSMEVDTARSFIEREYGNFCRMLSDNKSTGLLQPAAAVAV